MLAFKLLQPIFKKQKLPIKILILLPMSDFVFSPLCPLPGQSGALTPRYAPGGCGRRCGGEDRPTRDKVCPDRPALPPPAPGSPQNSRGEGGNLLEFPPGPSLRRIRGVPSVSGCLRGRGAGGVAGGTGGGTGLPPALLQPCFSLRRRGGGMLRRPAWQVGLGRGGSAG